ncbi:hypothetical protein LTR10_011856 [Elasticomyces elasticus]|nr:hypothetical protein LTR10_011856 [Elasticomyces elasticus]KAK4968800.1 hypothetical protein LTR42_009077 [Elasticomyces elasticus]
MFPAHIHEEVSQSREAASQAERSASPSGQFAGIHIGGESMSGSEHGGNGTEQRAMSVSQRVLGGRSASPAKRSAADMEDVQTVGSGGGDMAVESVPGSFPKTEKDGPTDFDHTMADLANDPATEQTQDTTHDSAGTSQTETVTANTSASSLHSGGSPLRMAADKTHSHPTPEYSTEELDQHFAQVQQALGSQLDVGEKGVVVSCAWLARVMSRTSEGLKSSDYPKSAREGPIGLVDNSDIVPPGAFEGPHLSDGHGSDFIPLKPGLTMGVDFEVVPAKKVWGDVVGKYGMVLGQHQINRYAIDTAPDGSTQKNVVYDNYPLIVTVRKVPHPSRENERPSTPAASSAALKKRVAERDLQPKRGQKCPDDAVKLVVSRTEGVQKFLGRAKEATGVLSTTKVRVWRLLDGQSGAVDNSKAGVISPPASRSTSPSKVARPADSKLVVPMADFKEMGIGNQVEHVDVNDETNNSKYNGKSTVETHGFYEDRTILLEEVSGGPAGGEFESDQMKRTSKFKFGGKVNDSKAGSTATSRGASPAPGGMTTRGRTRKDGKPRGVVGLGNLGNTCYMNSALQCIRSVEELAIYFVHGKYKKEINADNPLGHGGQMAKQYAGVLTGIYGPNAGSSFSPGDFKRTLGRVQPLFSGYGQQDSQEFLSFLVDALHEDLNRIVKKPYIENPDSDDKTVHDPQAIIELGETYRANHKARNDSICMDLFSGFYKNKMECPVCDKVSVTFDPYSLLTVQLPVENTFQHTVTFVPLSGAPINHAIDIDKNATIKGLKDHIASKHPGVSGDRLWMIEVYNHKIYKVFENHKSLAEDNIQTNDHIFVYELEAVPKNLPDPSKASSSSFYSSFKSSDKAVPKMDSEKADCFAVPVFSRQRNRFGSGYDITMHPLYVTLTRSEAQDYEVILKKVLIAVSQQTSRPILTEMSVDPAPAPVVEREESTGEDLAQISDRSVPSEDGYVEVSIGKANDEEKNEEMADVSGEPVQTGHPIPAGFMDPDYFISPSLRNGLFAMNYGRSSDGMLCASMSSIEERTVRNMFDRVKKPVRRASTQSASGESSTSGTTGQADGESEVSDADDEDQPDIVIGGGDESFSNTQAGSDDDLAPNPLMNRKDRRWGKKGRGKKGKPRTYGRKDKNAHRQRPGSSSSMQSQRSLNGKPGAQDDETYYVKLGEAIVIDWLPEGLDGLFGGNSNTDDDFRGHWLSSPEGRNLPFVPDPALEQAKQRRAARRKNGITLEDCFVETGKREILSEDNAWYCNRCKEMRQAAKTLEIWTIPDILIVHLKRFGGNRSFRDKIDVLVDYPIEGLDMTKKVGNKEDGKEYIYDLFAVDNHFGGLGGGHYTAFAKNFYNGQWYDYNDSSVSPLGDGKLHSAAAYLLFYRRRSETPLGPQYLKDLVTQTHNASETASAPEEVEDEESGEGLLDGQKPSRSLLHGSSSALVVAGAGTNGSSRNHGTNGSTGAGSSLTKRTSAQSDGDDMDSPLGHKNGVPLQGPVRPPNMQYGSQGGDWDWAGLDEQSAVADDDATDSLLYEIGRKARKADNDNAGGDADSATGEHGSDDEYDHGRDEFMPELIGLEGRQSTPIDSIEHELPAYNDYEDDHDMYNNTGRYWDGESQYGEALHLEDAGLMGGLSDSPPAQDVHLSGDETMTDPTHDKTE